MAQRNTFPLGGRWHGEAVTDEGKRGDFLGDNDKRGKIPKWYSCFPRRNPSVRQPLIRPSVRTGAPSPGGRYCAPASLQIPMDRFAERSRQPQRSITIPLSRSHKQKNNYFFRNTLPSFFVIQTERGQCLMKSRDEKQIREFFAAWYRDTWDFDYWQKKLW